MKIIDFKNRRDAEDAEEEMKRDNWKSILII